MPSILIISHHFPPDYTSGSKRALRMASHLADLGWRVGVLTVRDRYFARLDTTLLGGGQAFEVLRTRSLEPAAWVRHRRGTARPRAASEAGPIPTGGTPPGSRMEAMLRRCWTSCVAIPDEYVGWLPFAAWAGAFKMRPPDVVLATLGPSTNALVGWLVASFRKVPLVLDYRDPWSALRRRKDLPPWRRRLDQGLENLCLRRAALAVATTRGICEELVSLGAKRTAVVPNAFSAEVMAGVEPTRYERFTVVYAGTFYATRAADPILKGLGALAASGRIPRGGLALRVLGASGPEVRDLARRLGVDSLVEVEDFLPYGEAMSRIKGADVLLLVVGAEHGRQIPAKLFEYLAARRFILLLAPEGSDAGDIVRELNAGAVVDPEDVQAIARALCERYEARSPEIPMAEATRRYEARATMQELDRHLREALARP